MKSKLNFLPFYSLLVEKLNPNSIIFKIIKVFFIAILLSNPIYFSFFENLFLEFISPFLAIWGLVLLLKSNSKEYFWIGFFVGILWFWWIGLSSIYFDLSFLVPFIILIMGLIYGILFRICHLFKYDFLRLCAIFALTYIHPIGFDWLNWGIFTVYGVFDASFKGIAGIFLIAYFIYEKYISRYYKIAIILIIFFTSLQYSTKEAQTLNANYALINTYVSQDQKTQTKYFLQNSEQIITWVKDSIIKKKDLVVLPETSFAFDIKYAYDGLYFNTLKELSKDITIIVGAFNIQENKTYNSTYIFKEGKVKILNKHYLVPFGEEIPFFKDLVQTYFLPNMEEFQRGPKLNQYIINNQTITNAICYEATKEALYKNSKIIIAISNNAWFNHSSEYKLQKLLMQFYASKHGVSVYHATNGKESGVIKPKILFIQKCKDYFNSFIIK